MSQNDKAKAQPAKAAEGNVDQIRDILFGGQMRDYERRFEELEERSRRENERNRGDLLKRIENLEALVKDQTERLAAQTKKVDSEAKAANAELHTQLERAQKTLRQELSDVDDKHEHAGSSLRERLHKLATETADSIRGQQEELGSVIERMGSTLRDEKVAREELAGFFQEMALRLTRQFDLPKG
jgi:myosin heavy subunit